MKYVFKEECKTILVAVLGHTKIYIHFQSQSEINFHMAERCHYQRALRDLIFPSRHTYVHQIFQNGGRSYGNLGPWW